MSYLLFIQVHKKLLEKTIRQFKIIAYANDLSFRSEVYTGYRSCDSYVNLYLTGDKLVFIKKTWKSILLAIDTDKEIPDSIKDYWLVRVIKNKRGDLYDSSIRLANYMFPDSKEVANNFLEPSFSVEKYIDQLINSEDFEYYELLIQIRKKVSKNIINKLKEIAYVYDLEFKAKPYNKEENFTNFFIISDSLRKIKNFWYDISMEINNSNSSIESVRRNWAVVLYVDHRLDEYVILADNELPENSTAIANNFLDDNFSWYVYQDQFPEELINRKYDIEINIPNKKARQTMSELKKIVRKYHLTFGVGKDDKIKDKVDFYIIGYSYDEMKSVWENILLSVNDDNSSLFFLKDYWTVNMWRSNLKEKSLLLANSTKESKDNFFLRHLPNDDPFIQ